MLSLSPGGAVDGPGEEGWTLQNQKFVLHHHALHPKVPEFIWYDTGYGYKVTRGLQGWPTARDSG